MIVFLSWSGERGRIMALALEKWIRHVIQQAQPWTSPRIEAGLKWDAEISEKLASARIGVICVTRDSFKAPWLNFEAGVLAKQIGNAATFQVCPYLLDMEPHEVTGPLSTFQIKKCDRDGTLDLVLTLNRLTPHPLSEIDIREIFETNWPRLQSVLADIPPQTSAPATSPFDHKLDEILLRLDQLATQRSAASSRLVHELVNPRAYINQNIDYVLSKIRDTQSRGERIDVGDLSQALYEVRSGVDQVVRNASSAENVPASCDLGLTARYAARLASGPLKGAQVRINGPDIRVAMSQVSLTQVLLNLYSNSGDAIRETRRLGRLDVSWTSNEQTVQVRVRDNGCGIPDHVRPMLFEPFVSTKAPGTGTGLGLVIVRELLESAGGAIELDSQPGEWTEARLSIPRATM